MIQGVGELKADWVTFLISSFEKNGLKIKFTPIGELVEGDVISFDKKSTLELNRLGKKFYNWDLLFSILGPNDQPDDYDSKINERIKILKSIMTINYPSLGNEFHGSIRVHNLALSTKFYSWLFGTPPKEWTHRYVTFQRVDTKFNFVLLVSDGKELHQDTLYHLGMGVKNKNDVVNYYHSAVENGFTVEKLPRTTWRGTPLHELWLKDPDGTLIEVYARLTEKELEEMPQDKEPHFLV